MPKKTPSAAERLKTWRENEKPPLTLAEAGERLGCSGEYVRQMEAGLAVPKSWELRSALDTKAGINPHDWKKEKP